MYLRNPEHFIGGDDLSQKMTGRNLKFPARYYMLQKEDIALYIYIYKDASHG